MKKLLLLLTVITLAAAAIMESDFCTGYKYGYKKGWCFEQVGCVPPVPPVCPVPPVNLNTFDGGYQLGFLKALKDREEE